ncbi:MAG: efflux RND transporter periplasmic adaptor subunit [Gammaproteobacteria bacterium]|nr:efflux RND transporter periplasmic adaptor subunit [Gammaproteobacteria bacterium]
MSDNRPTDGKSDTGDDDDDDHPSRLRMQDGVLGIELTQETQVISGIRVQPAEAMQYRQEMQALAEVVSIGPLLELRTSSDRLRAEIRITEVELQRSREAYERLSLLHEDNANISTRQLEEARAQMQASLARLAAQKQQLRSLYDEAIQGWGEVLAEWALNANGEGLFQQLLKRHEVLLNLTLGRNQSLPETSRIIFINRDDTRINARKAYLISPAPRTEPSLQGETHFFHAHADKLRVGMRVHAWIPTSGETIDGVYAPADAVVWQAGQPWIYLHDGDDFFYRRVLDNPSRLSDGWFNSVTSSQGR